jgi:hypothetical protein
MTEKENRPPQLRLVATNPDEMVRLAARCHAMSEMMTQRFAAMAGTILNFLADGTPIEVDAVEEFLAAHEETQATMPDVSRVSIAVPDITERPLDPEEPTNKVLRGSLRMVATLMRLRGSDKTDLYCGAQEIITETAAIIAERNRQLPQSMRSQPLNDEPLLAATKSAFDDLAANILRVINGGGEPNLLPEHATKFARLHGRAAHAATRRAWQLNLSLQRAPASGGTEGRKSIAVDQMARGALQMIASKLLRQNTQRAHGKQRLVRGALDYAKACADDHELSLQRAKSGKPQDASRVLSDKFGWEPKKTR